MQEPRSHARSRFTKPGRVQGGMESPTSGYDSLSQKEVASSQTRPLTVHVFIVAGAWRACWASHPDSDGINRIAFIRSASWSGKTMKPQSSQSASSTSQRHSHIAKFLNWKSLKFAYPFVSYAKPGECSKSSSRDRTSRARPCTTRGSACRCTLGSSVPSLALI